ncbi:MAG TPA: PEGA domain-containing protein [Verrucomicrobiae bacterium]|nr:PEGA domain-containing protein [Verrucomicrobiae bacterium]
MKIFSAVLLAAGWLTAGQASLKAQPSSIETPANLKGSTEQTVVVVERTITEKTNVYQATNPNTSLRKIAIIVENRAGPQFNDKVPVLEDLVASRVAGKGYSVISRDVTINGLKSYSTAGINVSAQTGVNANAGAASAQNSTATGSAKVNTAQGVALRAKDTTDVTDPGSASLEMGRKDSAQIRAMQQQSQKSSGNGSASVDVSRSDSMQVSATPETTKLDQALSDNTSALRLAQNLGADYILIPAITSFGTEKRNYNGNGIATVNTTYKLRVSYKIVEANEGGAVRGSTVLAEKNFRDSGDLKTDSSDVINDLLDDAADQLADAIVTSAKALPTEVAKANMVTFHVACSMTDPRQQPIMVSAIGVSADNKLVTSQPVPVQAMDVTVEVDGVAIGSAPGDFKSRPGLHKLSLSREGFDTWSRTVNLYEGQKLNVALQMSVAGYARWKETTDFLSTIDNNRKLTDAEVNRINGVAEFFKNSHYRVDTKENVKVYKSLY